MYDLFRLLQQFVVEFVFVGDAVADFPAGFDGRWRWCGAIAFVGGHYGCGMFCSLLPPVHDQPISLVIGDESSLDALRFACIRWEIKHVAAAKQTFGSAHIDDRARIYG